ncbi:MAG: membrane protein insertase YidC [Propionibacteriaceae bacterium]|jgi:YidC/Oxa1 family membrane protein insertase|nr:membrane protein insertase YidC [Propionibacteriaceae bacterium]
MIPMLVPMDFWGDLVGFFGTILYPFQWAVSGLLVLFHGFLSLFMNPDSGWTWVVSIVLLTAVVRAALIPLFVKQINSMRNMQLIGPKIKELQDKYRDDRQRLGEETMKLYKEEGINPMASCLPILCQMPVFLSLFYVLIGVFRWDPATDPNCSSVTGYFLAQNCGLTESLRASTFLGTGVGNTFLPVEAWGATQTVALVMILLMCASLFYTQFQLTRKNMPPSAQTGPMAQQQKILLYVFPLLYAVGGASIPIGVLVYWLTTNLWTLGQQYILIKNNPAPGTPAYLDWEERMRAKGKDPDAIIAARKAKQKSKRKAAPAAPAQPSRPDYSTAKGANKAKTGQKPAGQTTESGTPKPPTVNEDGKTVVYRQQRKKSSRARRKS